MHHRVDTDLAIGTGLITWVSGNLDVTDAGTDHAIQPAGIDALPPPAAGDTVNVASGTYVGQLHLDRPVNLIGAGSAATTLTATAGEFLMLVGATTPVQFTQGMVIEGFTFASTP